MKTMNTKLSVIATAIIAGFANNALAVDPPAAPTAYNPGPASPQVATVNLSAAERSAYALYEGVLQSAEAAIQAKGSCSQMAGSYDLTVFADGIVNSPSSNTVDVTSPNGILELQATLVPPVNGYGQQVGVKTVGVTGTVYKLGPAPGVPIKDYSAAFNFNTQNTVMEGAATVSANGANGRYDTFAGRVIKDFYKGCIPFVNCPANDQYDVFDWGLQSLSKIGYPVNKYWQRSKSRRDDGVVGHTTFVKDRLVGSSSCRIVIDTSGYNNQDFFQQEGKLIISTQAPGVAYNWDANFPVLP